MTGTVLDIENLLVKQSYYPHGVHNICITTYIICKLSSSNWAVMKNEAG